MQNEYTACKAEKRGTAIDEALLRLIPWPCLDTKSMCLLLQNSTNAVLDLLYTLFKFYIVKRRCMII